jgi:lysophospholipase L1-like esterase
MIRTLLAWLLQALPVALAAATTPVQWLPFPDARLEVRGLPWFAENSPQVWRLPAGARGQVPPAVWSRAVAPDGGRIVFTSTTSRLALRVQAAARPGKPCSFDVFGADGRLLGSARLTGDAPSELVLFSGRARDSQPLTIYLPNNQEVRVLGLGLDADADLSPAPAPAHPDPLVCYGSSVLQGTGADHPANTYPAALARALNLDFVNLGFGGAGKAEPAVVRLVAGLRAACFLLDLGKSYGDQGPEAYVRMLAELRSAHPRTPIVCLTPIYSSKEPNEPAFREKSERLRAMMREAAQARQRAGDDRIHVVEGLDLFGPGDARMLRDPQHPNDEGNLLMARRLEPLLARVVLRR